METLTALGIDAGPHRALPEGVLTLIAGESERRRIEAMMDQEPHVHWDRLLFCAKEALYKAWFPIAKRSLGFSDADIIINPVRRTFHARLAQGWRVDGRELTEIEGMWLARKGLIAAAIALPRVDAARGKVELSCVQA